MTKLKQYNRLAWKLFFSSPLLPIVSKKTYIMILKRVKKRTETQWFERNVGKTRDDFSALIR